ncbi:MAG: hypothetical protein G3M70_04480 [Candidatus Nitronauta litoralis]|uniref:Uncharacterized protein n=1 Tax=Candidatus Nitronauta litoralis TaxID=2705533 RepID=A0A7T0BUK3_9BACT|nr:MAG: hypothetical protein G3M70_04480 [Candidatus Nitronauta litoralis]
MMTNLKKYGVLLFCLLSGLYMVAVSVSSANEQKEKPSKLFFLAERGKQSVPSFQNIPSETRLPSGEYSARAHMVSKIIKENRVTHSLSFQPEKENVNNTFEKSKGWSRLKDTYWWSPGALEQTLTVPLSSGEINSPVLNRFDEFHFDFQALEEPGQFPFLVGLELTAGTANPGQKKRVFIAGDHSLKAEETLTPAARPWNPKNYLYLLKRELNLEPDAEWRFIQKDEYTVVQRRFHKDIKSIEALDVVVPRNWSIKTINLKLGFEGPYRPTEILALHEVYHRHSKGDFEKTIRLHLGKLIREQYKKFKKINLEELVVFFEGPVDQVIQQKPLKQIVFHALDLDIENRDSIEIVQLPLEILPLSATTYRASVKLDAVKKKPVKWELDSARLKVNRENPSVPGGLVFRRAGLAQLETFTQPKIARVPKQRVHALGGPFLPRQNLKNIESVSVDSYFPFQVLDWDQPYHSGLIVQNGIRVQTGKASQARVYREKRGLACDVLFLAPENLVSMELESIGPFVEDREVTLELEREGNLLLRLFKPYLGEIKGNTIRFILPANTRPMIEVEPPRLEGLETTGRQRGRILFTRAEISPNLQEDSRTLQNDPNADNQKTATEKENGNGEEESLSSLNPLFLSAPEKVDFSSPGLKSRTAKSIRAPGLRIKSRHSFKEWRPVQGGILLEGRGRWIDLTWKHTAKLFSESRFYLSILKGVADVDHLEIQPRSGGKKLPPQTAMPNEPVKLNINSGEIDELNIRIHLKSNIAFSLVLSEMTLFHPQSTPVTQMLDLEHLIWERTPLVAHPVIKPKTAQLETDSNGIMITGSLTAREPVVQWSNTVNHPIGLVRGLRLKYQSAWDASQGVACWLKLNWKTAKHQGQKRLCFNNPIGDVYIPASSLFDQKLLNNHEPLESLVWRIEGPKGKQSTALALSLKMELDALHLGSLRHELARYPVFRVEEKVVSPASLEHIAIDQLVSREPWVELGDIIIPANLSKTFDMEVLETPYFNVEALVIQNRFPLPEGFTLQQDVEEIIPNQRSLSLLILIEALIFLGGLYFILKKTNIYPQLKSNMIPALKFLKRWLLGPHVILNRLMGLLVIGPGFLLSGYMNQRPDAPSFLEPLLLLFAGVVWHEIRWGLQKYPHHFERSNIFINGNNYSTPVLPHLVLAGAMGWSAWMIGAGISEIPTVIAAALCVSSIYFYLPWMERVTVRIILGLVFAGGCYLASLSQAPGSLLPSVGGLALIFTWLNILQWARPTLEKCFPKGTGFVFQSTAKKLWLGLLILVPVMALLIFLQLEVIAEPIAITIYLLMAGGILSEIWAHFSPSKESIPDVVSEDIFEKVSSGG